MVSSSSSEGILADWDMDEMMWDAMVAKYNRGNEVESSRHTRGPRKKRDHADVHPCLMRDYFDEDHVYDDKDFKWRFRVSREFFEKIAWSLHKSYPFFQQRVDAGGRVGFSTHLKYAAALHLLGTGNSADHINEYLKMSDRTARECVYNFCGAIYELYKDEYLRRPNANDIRQLFEFHEDRHGLPRMLDSLDCMHWHWQAYPTAHCGSYICGDYGGADSGIRGGGVIGFVVLACFFGTPEVHNDIIVIRHSDLFVDNFKGRAPDFVVSCEWSAVQVCISSY